jgi:gliding motility-associated-like protein
MGACSQANIPVVIKPCNDQFEPIISCPEPVEVSHIGTIISDPSNFLTNVSVSDNCLGVKVSFKTPTATDDCMSNPSVQQTSGKVSGSIFSKGTSSVFFEAVDKTGKKASCIVPITVSHAELIADEAAKLCLTEVLAVPVLPLSNAVYLWKGARNFTSTSATLTLPLTNVNMSGLYTLTATYGRNCTLKDSINLSVNDIPALKNDTFSLAVGGTVKGNVLTNDSLNSTAYKLNLMFNVKNGTLQVNNEGIMTYKATANFKGIEYFSYEVCTEQCPNTCPKADGILNILADYKQPLLTADEVITPNEDGYNDALVINDFDASDPDNTSSIIIYNQWGGIVYQAAPYLNDWNGTYKDSPLPTGTYYYIFKKDNTSEPLKSFITILR